MVFGYLMSCLLVKFLNVMIGKQNYVGPITPYCNACALKTNLDFVAKLLK